MSDIIPPERQALAVRLAEAAIFASSEPVSERALLELLQDQLVGLESGSDSAALLAVVLEALGMLYAQGGVRLVLAGGGWQFRTAPDLAPYLTKVLQRPRRLPRVAMETLSVIAYHQPCTRSEIEQIRGVSLSQATLDSLLEASLIVPKGRKEVPGRPVLWATSTQFLVYFGLRDLRDLPRREELLVELPDPVGATPRGLDAVAVPAAPDPC